MTRSKFAIEAVAIVNFSKLLIFQLENCAIFIDYGDIGMIVKLSI